MSLDTLLSFKAENCFEVAKTILRQLEEIFVSIYDITGIQIHNQKYENVSKNYYVKNQTSYLTYLFPMYFSLTPANIRKFYSFLMFSGDKERVHWRQMG